MIQRFLLALLLGLMSLPVLSPVLTPAALAAQTAPATPASAITVSGERATAAFPDGVTFELDATSPVPIVSAEIFFHPSALETLTLGTPELTPGEAISVAYTADFRGGQMPPGVDIAYFWRLTDANGAVLETPEQIVLWSDSRYEWQTLTGENVTVYAYNGDEAFNQAILDTAEATITRLNTAYDAATTAPIRIWAYNSGQDFAGALAPNSEPWIAGAAYPTLGLINSILPVGDMREVARIVPHEVSHQVLYQATRNPWNSPPNWLDEGLAVLAQGVGSENFPAVVQAAADAGQLESIRVLNSQFPYDAEGAVLGYAQSESIVRFIQQTYGEEGIARLIAIFREGVAYEEAVEGALGVTLDELNALWQASLGIDPNGGAGTVRQDDGGIGGAFDTLLAVGEAIMMGGLGLLAFVVGIITLIRARRRARVAPEPDETDPVGPGGPGQWPSSASGLIR